MVSVLCTLALLTLTPPALTLDRVAREHPLAATGSDPYALRLKRGEAVVVGCEQRGIDVVLRLLAPDGRSLQQVDVTGAVGKERLVFVAPTDGEYRVVVTPFDATAPAGAYTLWLEQRLRAAKTRDERVRQLIALHAQRDGPGAAVAVFQNGKAVYKIGFGLADLEHRVPITPRTVFHTASVSKQFTAFAIGLLAQEGKLAYDDDIHKYLPELHDFGAPVTLRHLLTHTSGLRDQWELLALAGWRLDDVITREHLRRLAFRQTELNFPPGTQELYSNLGYSLLAEIVERVAKEPFPLFMAKRVFGPLGMTRTRIHNDHQELIPERAYSYGMGANTWELRALNYANQGATSLFSTVEDLGRWLDNLDTHVVGGDALIRAMETPGTLANDKTIGYGFGLALGTYRGLKVVDHSGADAGFRSMTLRFPQQRLAVVVLSNQAELDPNGLAHQLADIYLEGKFPPPKPGAAPTPPVSAPPAVAVPTETLQRYVGLYQLRDDWLLDIELHEGELTVQASRESRFPMRAESETRFFVPAYNAPIVFEKDALLYKGITAPRVPPFHPDATALAAFTGTYYSPELETTYRLVVRDGKLVADHPRNDPITLTPTAPDTFQGNAWFFGEVRFETDAAGKPTGFRVSGSRVRNLRFVKKE